MFDEESGDDIFDDEGRRINNFVPATCETRFHSSAYFPVIARAVSYCSLPLTFRLV